MDDLYGNAWGEPAKPAPDTTNKPESTLPSWTAPKVSVTLQDDEADLSTPSWTTGSEIKWNEPSETFASGFSWSQTEPDLAWGVSTYNDIQLVKTPVPEEENAHKEESDGDDDAKEVSAQVNEAEEIADTSPIPVVPITLEATPFEREASPPPETTTTPPKSPVLSRPATPDGFGSFEDGFQDVSAIASDMTPELGTDAWGSAWANDEAVEQEEEPQAVDEWELAKRRKERLDRTVPPEVLAAIIQQCTEYCNEVWPDADRDKQMSKEEPWMKEWRNGLDCIDGLEDMVHSIVPDLVLQPPPQFTKTAIAKGMASSVRLSKNLPISKTSPFSHYMAAKGSTAWEAAIKGRKEVEEDVVPVGWRILEKQPSTASTDSPKSSRTTSGIFSFWGRRKTATPVASNSSGSREQSPTPIGRTASASSAEVSTDTIHVNQDTGFKELNESSEFITQSTLVTSTSTPAAQSLPEAASTTTPTPEPVPFTPITSYSDAPDPHDMGGESLPLQTAHPSAVSRFLNRFSRRRSNMSSVSSMSSLALSTDDLEFLSDIVPSADGNAGPHEDSVGNPLSKILNSGPLPPPLPPPPPPPSVTIPLPSTQRSNKEPSIPRPPLIPPSSKALHQALPKQSTDMDTAFDAFENPFVEPPKDSSAISVAPMVQPLPPPSQPKLSLISPASRPHTPSMPTGSLSRQSTGPSSPSTLNSVAPLPASKPASQPWKFPPPPASQPAPAPMQLQRSSSPGGGELTPNGKLVSSRPKPQPFTIAPSQTSRMTPPPLSAASTSSNSDLPLGDLYPEAIPRSSTPLASNTRAPVPILASSLTTPQASIRARTPVVIMSRTSSTSSSSVPVLAPPPSMTSVPAPTAALAPMHSNDIFDDDDDFADFQSSDSPVRASATEMQTFFPPPPSSSNQRLTSLAVPSPLPPPSLSEATSSTRLTFPSTQSSSVDLFSDDFSSFLSSPSSSTNLRTEPSQGSDLGSSFSLSNKSLLPPKQGDIGFEIRGPSPVTLRTPSPPRPPSKPPVKSIPRLPVLQPPPPEKKVKTSQHLHTLSLVEMAAARQGQWPAPPSPLPQALSFPHLPPPSSASQPVLDFLGEDDTFGSFQSQTMQSSASTPAVISPPRITSPPLVPQSQSLHSLFSIPVATTPKTSTSTLMPTQSLKPTSTNGKAGGGLSAQDLSFFEGL